jgi:hypothetical protein
MRSSAARLTLGAAAWIALGIAAFLLFRSEQHLAGLTSALRTFDQHAHDASDALADLRASQQAYVAAGQGVAFWMPKVATTVGTVTTAIDALKESATAGARTALDEAAATMTEFGKVDQRAREYLKSGQSLMAADVIFSEGGDAAATAARQVETARLAEHQAHDAAEAAMRKQEAITLAGAAALAGIIVLMLIPVPRGAAASEETAGQPAPLSISGAAERVAPVAPAPVPQAPATAPSSSSASGSTVLKAAADLATDFGRLRNVSDLTRLLGRAADMMDASGVMIWLGSAAGADLRVVLAHGYSDQMVARIPPVPRSGDNAAAAAYRSGTVQLVHSRPGGANGAVVAPILSADGCIGALSAEIRRGGETSDSVQALATIFASHLAGVLSTAPAADVSEPKAAAGSQS